MDRVLRLNGMGVYVDVRGADDAPPVLFLHGGPGQSCFDFQAFQADVLAETMRVVMIDQRGILRSDPLPEGYPISIAEIVADCEALRRRLGIERWGVVGHSAGGPIAFDYALAHPEAVAGVVFDSPALDCDATDRHRLPKAAVILDEIGEHAAAAACREFAARPERLTGADGTYKAMQKIGSRYDELFFREQAMVDRYEEVRAASGFSSKDWMRGLSHLPLVAEMYVDRTAMFASLPVPSMLLHGVDDLVAAPSVIERYRRRVTDGRVVTLEKSAHFGYIEEPEAWAAAVSGFLSPRAGTR